MAAADHAQHGHHTEDHYGETHHYDYVKVWGGLVILLIISILGPLTGIEKVTLFLAFGVAVAKAYLVARYFMHVNVTQPVVHYFLITALVFMAVLFAGVSPDVMKHSGDQWTNDAAHAYAKHIETLEAKGGGEEGGGEH